ncbi:hypothetical protein D187_001364 [Cystobacter fuscus DSM 2262]|uniref:Uncharacterized protein n=1 Tax=Cystobacter fuscus (strain ATCC 25194 / DSM 2262 / NBRC 100088 / M29) TaxID=1242864 RepID=S9P8F6_CYSF2|nr:hypothetical protein [Cystobacter fuscus]EPX60715.1 hypothetical protein D187_001364 [Cystobacter fuscus DSM 2262]
MLSRTFDFDVFVGVRCGGRRRLLADVKGVAGVRAVVLVTVGLGVRHLASVETRPYVYFHF